MSKAVYEVRKRRWPASFPPLKRPWELLRDGLPISFFETEKEAQDIEAATLAVIEQKKEAL